MDILYLLVPLSIVLVFLIGAVFWYAVERGQFDDLEGPGLRIIADDDSPKLSTTEDTETTEKSKIGVVVPMDTMP